MGQRTDYGYDTFSRMTTITQAAVDHDGDPTTAMVRPVTTYGFNIYGQQTSITDANGHVTKFTFNEYGQQLSRTLPDDGNWATNEKEEMFYNEFGDLDYSLDFNGTKTDRIYDYELANNTKFGRLMQTTWTASGASTPGVTVNYTFDSRGRSDQVIEIEGGITRITDTDYDNQGHVVKITRPEGVIEYGYDPLTDHMTEMFTTNTRVQYDYDWLGRLTKLSETKRAGANLTTPLVTAYTYDMLGNTSKITVTEGDSVRRETVNTFDDVRHWLDSVTNYANSVQVSKFEYTRRDDGQITQVIETAKQPSGVVVGTTNDYTYDAINRLTKEVVTTNDTTNVSYQIEYKLDLVGNRMQKIRTGSNPEVTTNAYNARDQLLTETTGATIVTNSYDSNGSLTTSSDGTATRTQTWDLRGRLSGASINGVTTSYHYTPDGIRCSSTENGVKTLFVIDMISPSGFAQVIEERTESGLFVAGYVYGSSLDPISITKNLDSTTGLETALYLADSHSGVRQLVDLAGVFQVAQRYDTFGGTVAKVGPWAGANSVGYRGERFDANLGQYYLRARYYDPRSGRLTGVDPFSGITEKPATFHKYLYAQSNPVYWADPTGWLATTTVPLQVWPAP